MNTFRETATPFPPSAVYLRRRRVGLGRARCFEILQLKNDGNSSRKYWVTRHWATAKSKSTWNLRHFDLSSEPYNNNWNDGLPAGTNAWIDWDPKSDGDAPANNCGLTVSVQASVVSLSSSNCDEWDVTKYEKPMYFKNQWVGWANRSERAVAYEAAAHSPNDHGNWRVDHNYYAV